MMERAEMLADARSLEDRIYDAMKTLRPDASRFNTEDEEAVTNGILVGFIENREQTKPCRTCGTARVDYRYFRITAGGRLFMSAIERARTIMPDPAP